MGNCLVTKLKGSVDADLPKFGEIKFKMNEGVFHIGGTDLYITTEEGVDFNIGTGGSLDRVKEKQYTGQVNDIVIKVADNPCTVIVKSKYNIDYIGIFDDKNVDAFDISELNYCNMRKISITESTYGVFEPRFTDKLTILTGANTKVAFNIDCLKDSTILSQYELRGALITGSINNIKSPVLTSMHAYSTQITGDVDTMIQNMIAAGRTSGSFYFSGNSNITVKGVNYQTFHDALPGTGGNCRFTIDPEAPDGWTAVKG